MPVIDVVRTEGTPHESVHGLREDTTSRGVDLDGARIVATYADGSTEVLTWQALDPYTNGGATGQGIDLFFGNDWHALSTSKLLTSLEIDLQPASSVFDTTFTTDDDPAGGSTPGSKNGFPFHLAPEHDGMSGQLAVTYSGVVNLEGSPAQGDLYTTMVVDFTGLPEGGFLGDLKWNSDIDTMKVDGDLVPTSVPCLTRGTLVATQAGEVPVEALRPGDMVQTMDRGWQPVKLVLRRRVTQRELARNKRLYPVRIRAGALGEGIPKRDLLVSRQHRMAVRSGIVQRMFDCETVLVAAIRLTGLPNIHVDETLEEVEYFHLILSAHEIVFAEGAATESFLANRQTIDSLAPAARREFTALFPEYVNGQCISVPVRKLPSRLRQKRLIRRHLENRKDLYCV